MGRTLKRVPMDFDWPLGAGIGIPTTRSPRTVPSAKALAVRRNTAAILLATKHQSRG
jgi:hypothetical protein